MKKLFPLFVAVLLLLGGKTFAQKTFEPLLTENTVLFVHADFCKVELDTVKAEIKQFSEEFLKNLQFDAKSSKATLREFDVELGKLDAQIRPIFETITQKLGIKELALISDFKLMEKNIPSVLVAPWNGKTDADLQTLLSLLPDAEDRTAYYAVGDFLMIPFSQHNTERKTSLEDWVKHAVPAKDGMIQQALQGLGTDEIKIAVALPESVKNMIVDARLPNEISPPIKNLLLYASRKIDWVTASFSLADLAKGKILKEDKTLFTIKTAKDSDASQLRAMLESAIDLGLSAAQFAVQQNSDANVPPLVFEFGKGFLRSLLPDIEDNKLIFRIKADLSSATSFQSFIGIPTIIAIMSPAIQASREARLCPGHEKNIVLALHNYHDAYRAFPPLYTVDADGKPLHSWRVLILPFLEQQALYEKIRLDEPWDSEYNKQFHHVDVPIFRCPSNFNAMTAGKQCCYSVIVGEGFVPAKKAGEKTGRDIADITDGTSNTLAVVEVKEPFCWMDPTADITLDELVKGINAGGRVGSFHPTGINGALLDGSVHFLSNGTPKETLKALGTCKGRETVRFP